MKFGIVTPSRGDVAQPSRSERSESGDRVVAAERPPRPERTEAERAARREKREKREGREKRREREPRAAAPATDAPESGVGAITLGATAADVVAGTPVLSVVRPDAQSVASPDPSDRPEAEAGPTRKRKRRRRRGQRDAEKRLHLPAEKFGERRAAALVRNVNHVYAR